MPIPSVTYIFSNGFTADAKQVNTNFNDIVDFLQSTTLTTDQTLTANTPKDITVSPMDARKCIVIVRDPANDYRTVLIDSSAPDANTIRLDVGNISNGTYRVLISEMVS